MDTIGRLVVLALATTTVAAREDFDPRQHLGGNGQWFPGPEVTGISSEIPDGCIVDMAASVSRHGSRYPDRGAYNEWTNLSSRIQSSSFTVRDKSLNFLSTWQPVLEYPDQQIAQISTTGYAELTAMGASYRHRYSHLYEYNTPFPLWANYYISGPRVRDSARMFAHGFLGPNATALGSIYALNSSSPSSFMNSLATSDLCPAYEDESGGVFKIQWESIYLPPIQKRLNREITGAAAFQFTQYDISIIPYLCGFESQITGSLSPWCDIFTEEEILQYEYAQDLRYWYGNGLGMDIEPTLMLPVLSGVVNRFKDGPNSTYTNSDGSMFRAPDLMVGFTNDGQMNQLVAGLGVFDDEEQLPGDRIPRNRKFVSSRFITMRGTVALERLTCSQRYQNTQQYVRIKLNDVVYPVTNCDSGPGRSCPLNEYEKLVSKKISAAGNYGKICNVTNAEIDGDVRSATFLTDTTLPFGILVKP